MSNELDLTPYGIKGKIQGSKSVLDQLSTTLRGIVRTDSKEYNEANFLDALRSNDLVSIREGIMGYKLGSGANIKKSFGGFVLNWASVSGNPDALLTIDRACKEKYSKFKCITILTKGQWERNFASPLEAGWSLFEERSRELVGALDTFTARCLSDFPFKPSDTSNGFSTVVSKPRILKTIASRDLVESAKAAFDLNLCNVDLHSYIDIACYTGSAKCLELFSSKSYTDISTQLKRAYSSPHFLKHVTKTGYYYAKDAGVPIDDLIQGYDVRTDKDKKKREQLLLLFGKNTLVESEPSLDIASDIDLI